MSLGHSGDVSHKMKQNIYTTILYIRTRTYVRIISPRRREKFLPLFLLIWVGHWEHSGIRRDKKNVHTYVQSRRSHREDNREKSYHSI